MPIQLLSTNPSIFVIWVFAIVFGITVHEFGHALADYLQGDDTAKANGRLTLNPIAHIDPLGFIMLLFVGFGWGKPTPFNPYNLRARRWGAAIVSFAGPILNLLFVVVFGFAFRILFGTFHVGTESLLATFLIFLVQINLVLMVFNLIPIPPLDGSKILYSFLPPRYDDFKFRFERQGPFLLLGLLIADNLLGLHIFSGIFSFFLDLVGRIVFA